MRNRRKEHFWKGITRLAYDKDKRIQKDEKKEKEEKMRIIMHCKKDALLPYCTTCALHLDSEKTSSFFATYHASCISSP